MEGEWVAISSPVETIADRITRIKHDISKLEAFHSLPTSTAAYTRLRDFYDTELADLAAQPFESHRTTQDDRVDYLLLQTYLKRARRTLELDRNRDAEIRPLIEPFAADIKRWCEARQRVDPVNPQEMAASLAGLNGKIAACRETLEGNERHNYSKAAGLRAVRTVDELRAHLREMFDFYTGYDPLFDWWVKDPYARLDAALAELVPFLREKLMGVKPGDEDAIVGEPIGRDGLLTELEAEMIPYSPEELIRIAEMEYEWCEAEMIKASTEAGFGEEWRDALEFVKGLVEPPAAQPMFVRNLVDQGTDYVKKHDLMTIPKVAEEAIRMVRIPPVRQKVSPFFLGGGILQLSYPTVDMAHEDKLMSMRGNNRHFCKATAFHEMIPGHHLQKYMSKRIRPYRKLFTTPFYVEGWALYGELLFWQRGDFFTSPEDRIGTLFWRMHRCARIIFSLNFHLGKMTPQECVDLLVNWVGHERSTAEGEVRRSFNGSYSPLYQAGYLLGALQLWKLRGEVVRAGKMSDKEFHDAILRANEMPIEMLRALILEQDLHRDFKSSWRFYDGV